MFFRFRILSSYVHLIVIFLQKSTKLVVQIESHYRTLIKLNYELAQFLSHSSIFSGSILIHLFLSILFFSSYFLSCFESCHFLAFPNTLLCDSLTLLVEGKLSMCSCILQNATPWSGLVKKSASIFSVGQYVTLTSPHLIWSVTKNYLTLRYFIHLLLDALPFSDSRIVLLLSW